MNTDMAGICSDNALILPKEGIDHCLVRLGSSDQKEHIRIRAAALPSDLLPGRSAVRICAVPVQRLTVIFGQCAQNFLMGPLCIVTFK